MLLTLHCLFDHAGTLSGNGKPAGNLMQEGSHGDGAGDGMTSMDDLRQHAWMRHSKCDMGRIGVTGQSLSRAFGYRFANAWQRSSDMFQPGSR